MKTSSFRALAGCLFGLALGTSTSLLGQTSPFVGQDVGAPSHPGGFTNNIDGTISINGGGDDIWNNGDNCFFYYTSVTGLVWEAKMRVVSFTGPDFWSKIELMVRRPDPVGSAPQGGDPQLDVCTTQASQQNEIQAQWRGVRAAGSGNSATGVGPSFPNHWVRMTRTNSVFGLWYGTNGVNWTLFATQDTVTTANGFDGIGWENPILVGAAVTAHNNGDANGATAVVSNLTVNVYPFTPPTAAGVVTQIQSTATFQYTEASFTFVATNNANPNILNMSYAWYKNNQLVSTNPMGTRFTFLTTPADNGAQIYAVGTAQFYPSITVTSAVATLTVNPPSSIYTNGLKREFFTGGTRQNVEIGNVGRATTVGLVSAAETPGGFGDNYTDRYSGYFIPPTTAAYVFFVAADDDTDVYLSMDSNPANKALIAQEPGWSPTLSWLVSGSGGALDLTQKRSDQWSPDPLSIQPPNPNGFYLTQGNLYYIEMVHHNGGGGDNFAVTYQTTNQIADPNWTLVFTNGLGSLLNATNNNIALITSPITTLSWALQPTNLTVFEGQAANFYSKAVSDSELALIYQWYTIAPPAPINGATGPTLSIPVTPANYNGLQGYCVARAAEGSLSAITSSIVTLTVNQAVWEPGFAKDERWDGVSRPQVESGGAGTPGYIMSVPAFEVGVDNPSAQANFARRVSGYFVPPTTGNYVFFVNGDDDTDLFISTDNTPGNKRLVCQETGWSNPWTWVGQGGGGSVSQKRSDQWSNGTGTPWAAGIPLTAGQRYYMEADFHQGSGGANVEATYKLLADPDPGNGADTRMKGDIIGINAVRCLYVAYTQQPVNATAPPFGRATFTAVGTTDSQLAIGSVRGNEQTQTNNFIFYQWYKNGVAVAGANGGTYVIDPVLPADNGAVIQCQIRALGYADNSLTRLWSNSVTATVTVSPAAVFEPGWALVQWWDVSAPSRATIEAGAAAPPQHLFATPRFESALNGAGDNYANRLLGYFVPPTTGDYVFFMNSDDDADLFLSTDATPGNKRLIGQEVGWSGTGLGWSQTGGGGDTLAQRRSDQFTDPATGTQPYSAGIHMIAGQRYYMEGVHKEGGGGDYFAATYKLISDIDPANGTDSSLVGNAIGMYAPRIPWVAFLSQPSGQTATSGGNSVTFSASGYSAPSIMPGNTGDPRGLFPLPATNVTFQWFKNGTPIAGATASSYTLVPILPSDNNAQFVCGIRALGYADNSLNAIYSNSVPAVLNVITDTVPPTISYAATIQNTNPLTPLFSVDVTFSEWMDSSTLTNPANYSVAGATITNIVLVINHRTVELQLNQMPTLPLNITVNGVKDISGNTIALNSQAPINPVGLTSSDIGLYGVDPAYPSKIWVTASGGYIISAEGSDIWGNADGFNFTWELKTNDFDVVVRGAKNSHTSNWAKMGLMVRETLDSNSRNWNIVNDPAAADGINAPDGSGFGANDVECNMRDTTGAASGGWRNLSGGAAPAYPNAWVRLKRTGNLLEAFRSVDGLTWTRSAAYDTGTNVNGALPSTAFVGLCTTAHNNDTPGGDPNGPLIYYNTVEYANYTSSYIPPAQLTAVVSGANLIVSWTPNIGHLEASPAISGPGVNWQPVGGGNPATIPIGPGPRFFRVKNP